MDLHGDGQGYEYTDVMCGADTSSHSTPETGRGVEILFVPGRTGVVWHQAKQNGAEGVNDFYMRMLS